MVKLLFFICIFLKKFKKRYYTKYDVDVKKTAEFEDVIGDYEVFEPLSIDLQIVNIYDLRGIAKIVSEKEYDSQQETLQENYFLTRF